MYTTYGSAALVKDKKDLYAASGTLKLLPDGF